MSVQIYRIYGGDPASLEPLMDSDILFSLVTTDYGAQYVHPDGASSQGFDSERINFLASISETKPRTAKDWADMLNDNMGYLLPVYVADPDIPYEDSDMEEAVADEKAFLNIIYQDRLELDALAQSRKDKYNGI